MTTIYLVRHAEAEGNLYRVAQGHDDSNLTPRGWRQVRAVERRFADIHVDAVYSSDLYRTCATAGAVYKPKGLPLHRTTALREICIGAWERNTWGDIYQIWPEQVEYFGKNPKKWYVEGAERPEDVLERVLKVVTEIAAAHPGETVALFSHGYAIRLLLAHLQGIPLEDFGTSPIGCNTAVSCLEAENGTMRVVFRDDDSHLKTPEYLAEDQGARRAGTLESGLYYRPLHLPEQAEEFTRLAELCWQESGETDPFEPEVLLQEAAKGLPLLAYSLGEVVGMIQLGAESGSIQLLTVRKAYRKRGFGTQMIGQAVYRWRARGSTLLRISVPANSAARSFFAGNGFVPAGERAGRLLLEKDTGFLPEYLGQPEDTAQ